MNKISKVPIFPNEDTVFPIVCIITFKKSAVFTIFTTLNALKALNTVKTVYP